MIPDFKQGDKLRLKTAKQLEADGWTWETQDGLTYTELCLTHPIVSDFHIAPDMEEFLGKEVTVYHPAGGNKLRLYCIKEDTASWRFALHEMEDKAAIIAEHIHTEGQTPIDGFYICKDCGADLRPVK